MTPTIAKFLDDVEAGVIPEDEVKHRTRLVRNELHVLASTLPKKVAEAVMVCVQWHDEQASAAQKLYQMHEQGIERTRNETGTPAPGYVDGLAREGQAIRLHRRAAAYFRRQLSRPAPAHPMAPTKDAHLNELLARAKACGPMTEEERAAQRESYVRAEMAMGDEGTCVVPPTPPADDSAVQRVAVMLWALLDDIDTLDDAVRSNDALYRVRAREMQALRHRILPGDDWEALWCRFFPQENPGPFHLPVIEATLTPGAPDHG